MKGRKMTLWNRAEGTIDLEGNEGGERIMEGKASSHPGKGKEIVEDSNPEEEHSPSPAIRTQMVLPVKELPHFEGTKREDVIGVWMRLLRELAGQTRSGFSLWPTCLVGMQLH